MNPVGKSASAWNAGYAAYGMGVPMEKNPHLYTAISRGGIQRSAWWQAGWQEAKRVAEGEKQK